jgi:hypothetical protein
MSVADPGAQPPQRRAFPARFVGALRADSSVYEEVEHDRSALWQAGVIVLLGGLARGIGAFSVEGWPGVVGSVVSGVVFWLVTALLLWGAGVRRLHANSDYLELLRTLGFAATPLVLLALGAVLPHPLQVTLSLAAHAWAVGLMVLALQVALDVSLQRALLTCALALLVVFLVMALFGLLLVGEAEVQLDPGHAALGVRSLLVV